MRCPKCQHYTDPEAAFCPTCKTKLVLTCTHCGSDNSIIHNFCKNCGTRFTAVSPASSLVRTFSLESHIPIYLAEKIRLKPYLENERKQITVLFADIKSSLELLTDRDAEDASKIFDAVLERIIESTHRYEGTVNQLMGDGAMALFGAPVAHEDHALRACYAALMMQGLIERYSEEIRRTIGCSVQIRVGINAGEVIIHSIRRDYQMDYSVVGSTVHLASRMEQIASPGSILMTSNVMRLVEGYIDVKPLGPVPVKGLQKPIEVFEVVGAGFSRSRMQASIAQGLGQFVGRAAEMHALGQALAQAEAGHGQIVAVVGEAGVGKSRLLHEFVHSHHTRGWIVLEGNTVSYGRATPYLPVINLFKNYFKIDPRDGGRTIREKVTAKFLASEQSVLASVPPVLDLLDALPEGDPFHSLDPTQKRQRIVKAVEQLILQESRARPLIVLFEDLHWNDQLSLDLLDEMMDSFIDDRILLILSYRTQHRTDWRNRPNFRVIQVHPLPRENVAELLHDLLGPDPTIEPAKALLIERAEGNPFFLEELVRTLVETGILAGGRAAYRLALPVTTIHVPPKVQAVIAARIDRLPKEGKQLLQVAAVIGKEVPFSLLTAVSGQPEEVVRIILTELQESEFLYETQLFPELEYTFKHALTHKVAYDELLQERRRDVHARIVSAIERLQPDRLYELVESLAHHAFLGEVWVKALKYLRQAGAKFVERPATLEAVNFLQQALQALKHLPEERNTLEQGVDIRFEIRNALQPLGELDQILGYLQEAEHLARQLNDRRRLGWVAAYLAEHFRMLGKPEAAAEAGERALAIAHSLADFPMQVVTRLPMGLLHHSLGEYRQAVGFFRFNIDQIGGEMIHERFGLFGLPSVFSRTFLAYCLAELGEFAEAIAVGEQGIHIANAADQPYSRVYAHLGTGYVYLVKGELQQAISSLQRAVEIGEFTRIPVGFSYGASYLGYALALAGRVQEGLQLLEQVTGPPISTRLVARHSLRVAYLGQAYLLAGRINDAGSMAARALELARTHKERGHEAYVLRLLGEVAEGREDFAAADSYYRSGIQLSETLEMRPLTAKFHWGLARLSLRLKNANARKHHAAIARALFREMDMVGWLYRMESEFESRA